MEPALTDDLVPDVSDTALWVAACRAIETELPDALFSDPLADRLAGERGRAIAATIRDARATMWSVAIRTVVVDEFLRSAIASGVETILSLGEAAALADDLRSQPSFELWVTDYFSPALLRTLRKRRSMANAPFRFDPPDWEAFFSERGWHLKEMRYLGEESVRLHRDVPMPLLITLVRPFLPRRGRREMLRMTGYAVLERGA